MAFAQRARILKQPVPIDRRAADNLRYIRDTMERAASFTAVPGWGGVLIGCTALAAGALAFDTPFRHAFFVWLVEAAVAFVIAIAAVRLKSRRLDLSLHSKAARRALLSFVPPAHCRSRADRSPVPIGSNHGSAGSLAFAIWRGGRHGRRFLGAYCSGYGNVLHVAGCGFPRVAGPMGKRFPYPRVWSAAYCLWRGDCEEARWLNQQWRGLLHSSRILPDQGTLENALPHLDRIIHERMRLGIVSALAVNETLTFNELKKLLQTSDGNLSVHARRLEEAEYVACTKSFEGRMPKTEYRLTASGRQAFERYLDHMEALIQAMREGS